MRRVLIFLFAVACCSASIAVDKPNIILIMADDMGWECVSAYRDLIAKYNYPKAKLGEKDHYTTPISTSWLLAACALITAIPSPSVLLRVCRS